MAHERTFAKIRDIKPGQFFKVPNIFNHASSGFTYFLKLRDHKAVNLNSYSCVQINHFVLKNGISLLNDEQEVEVVIVTLDIEGYEE